MTRVGQAAPAQFEASRERGHALPRSDELLARLVSAGGERPFRALYERYHGQLYRYCYSIVRNEADAQDALQSTFTRALVALREERRDAPLRPWLYRIAHNESISVLRAQRRVAPEIELDGLAVGPSAEERAHERARLQTLLSDLTQLTERGRAALVMRELAGLSHDEIAAALNISLGAAKQAIFEARGALLELEEGRAMACGEVMRKLSDGDRRVLRGRQVRAHLRDCASCAAFATAIPARQAELRALTPVLPPAAAAAVLGQALQGAGQYGAAGASAASGGSAMTGSAGAGAGSSAAAAAKVLAAIATPKALLATAVIAGVAAGGGGLLSGSSAHHAARTVRNSANSALSTGPSHGAHSAAAAAAAARGRAAQRHAASPASKSHHSTSSPSSSSPGNSGSAPGRTSSAPGNSNHATSRTGVPPGISKQNHAPPGLTKHNGTPPGLTKHNGTPPGLTKHNGTPPGLTKHGHSPPGQSKHP